MINNLIEPRMEKLILIIIGLEIIVQSSAVDFSEQWAFVFLGSRPQFVFDSPGPNFYLGPGPQVVFTGPG